MSIVGILEVATGMIFAWLVISLAGMYIQELIVSKLNWRSHMLENSIGNLLANRTLARQVYDHQLVKSLYNGFDGQTKPSYIPSGQFSLALIDIIRNSPKEAAFIQQTLYELENDLGKLNNTKRKQAQQQLDQAIDLTRKAITNDSSPDVANGILDDVKKIIRKLSPDYPELQPVIEAKFTAFAVQKKQIDNILSEFQTANSGTPQDSPIYQFKAGLAVMGITHPDLKQALEALTIDIKDFSDKTINTLETVGANIEDWFNNSMDRLSGWYKRRAQTLAFFIGLSLALILNVDSLQLATQLWRDPIMRQALAAQADALVSQNPNGVGTPTPSQLLALNTQITQLNVPVGWIGTALPASPNGTVVTGDGVEKLCTPLAQSATDLFGLYLGSECYPMINTPGFNDLTGWLMKLFGLLISGIAAAQGAPFWFDILKNVVNVRLAGANSDAAPQKG